MEKRFEKFTTLVAKLSRNIRRIKTEEVAEYHLKGPHVSCLYTLYKNGEMNPKELCELCDEDKAAISRSIETLKDLGYIEDERVAKKRYKEPLKLTEEGRKIGEKITRKIDSILSLAGEGISEEERAVLYKCLDLISENLQKICDGYVE